jgi:tetratricopeptide (TPR) repeat protein
VATHVPSVRRGATDAHHAARVAYDAGRLGDARYLASEAIDAVDGVRDADTSEVVGVLLTAAAVEEATGDLALAQKISHRAARIAAPLEHTGDPDEMPLWVTVQTACANLSSTVGDHDGAEKRLTAALDRAMPLLGPNHDSVIALHNARADNAKCAGRMDDAGEHYRQVRTAIEGQGTVNHCALATLLHDLGGLYHSQGNVEAGLTHAQRGLALRVQGFGHFHPEVARDLNALGALYHEAGDASAADTTYSQALAILERTLGPDHYEVGVTSANLAVTVAAGGDAVGASELYRRALTILRRCIGEAHPDVVRVQHNLTILLATSDGCGDLSPQLR